MKYPQIIIIPIMMILDYYLTLFGNKLRDKKFSKHIKVEQYELNPIWQKDVRRQKLFNPRHLISVVLVFFILLILTEYLDLHRTIFEVLFGFAVVVYGMIIGRHISNILTFYRVIINPDDVSGEITFSHEYSLLTSLYQYLVAVVPLLILSAYLPSLILIGGSAGAICFLVTHIIWLRRYKKKKV